MNRSRLFAACAALTYTLLLGRITDRTTGQPLPGVRIAVRSGAAALHTVTDAHGRFRFARVRPGTVTLRYASNDVPPKTITVRVRGPRQHLVIAACSTTLDYSCEGGGGS
jgi:protocatechuate 3,4-dioxygenase beta subunit